MKQYGWLFLLGVILGRELARIIDHLPFIVKSVQDMRDFFEGKATTIVVVDSDDEEVEGDE